MLRTCVYAARSEARVAERAAAAVQGWSSSCRLWRHCHVLWRQPTTCCCQIAATSWWTTGTSSGVAFFTPRGGQTRAGVRGRLNENTALHHVGSSPVVMMPRRAQASRNSAQRCCAAGQCQTMWKVWPVSSVSAGAGQCGQPRVLASRSQPDSRMPLSGVGEVVVRWSWPAAWRAVST